MNHANRHVAFAIPAVAVILVGLVVSPAAAEEPAGDFLADRLYAETEPGSVALFPCQLGEEVRLDASGIERVAVDDASIVKVRAVDDGATLTFDCQGEGTTVLSVDKEGRRHLVAVRVAPAVESPSRLDTRCGDLSGAETRVILGRGAVTSIVTAGAKSDDAACLNSALRKTDWSRHSENAAIVRINW